MPERGFDTGFWSDPFVQSLPVQGKLLFTYLKMNAHCNQAGVYTITPSTIAFETGLPLADIPGLLKSLEPEVVWYPEESVVWVKPFFEEQARSSKFIASALSIVTRNRLPEDVLEDFQEYNSRILAKITTDYPIGLTKRESVAIRDKFVCQYCLKAIKLDDYQMDHIIPKTRGGKDNYLNLVASCRACNQKKMDKTPDEAGLVTPHPRAFHAAQAVFILKNSPELKKVWLQFFPERETMADSILNNIEQHYSILTQDTPLSVSKANAGKERVVKGERTELTEERAELLHELRSLKHWRTTDDDAAWLGQFIQEFPEFSREMMTACADYHSGRSEAKHKGQWKNRLRNWVLKQREFAAQRRDSGQRGNRRVQATRTEQDFKRGSW